MKESRLATAARRVTHGLSGSREYRIWMGIRARCYLLSNPAYSRYGGRGIVMSDKWRDSFEAFYLDMGRRPTPSHTVERIDNNGPYSADNCRWATRAEQNRNYGRNRPLTMHGDTRLLSDWADITGIDHQTITNRIGRLGWSIEEALTLPASPIGRMNR